MKKFAQKSFAFKAKKVEDTGRISGYASVFGVKDSYGDVVMPGAFAESIAARKESGRPLPMLWQHRSSEPIGGFDVFEEDEYGLTIEGDMLVQHIERAREAHALAKADILGGFSIGYWLEDGFWNEKTKVYEIRKVDLIETSLVTFPANIEATIDSVKSAAVADMIRRGELPTLRQFEEFLRESGFSKTQAAAISGKGFAALCRGEPEGNEAAGRVLSALENFKLGTL